MKGSVTYKPKEYIEMSISFQKLKNNRIALKYKCAPETHQSSPLNPGLFLLLMLKFLKVQDVRSVRIDEVEHEHEYSLRLIRSLVFLKADLLSMNRLTQTLLSP